MKVLLFLYIFTLSFFCEASGKISDDCKEAIFMGDKYYKKTIFSTTIHTAFSRIVVDDKDNVFYRYNDKMYIWKNGSESPELVNGIKGNVTDLIKDKDGNIIVSINTKGVCGLYKYTYPASTVILIKTIDFEVFEMMHVKNGTFYLTPNDHYEVKCLHDLQAIPENCSFEIGNAFSLAMNKNGDLYFTNTDDELDYVLVRGHMEAIQIVGIPAKATYLISVDMQNNNVFLCTLYGLYVVKPGTNIPTYVDGFGTVHSMGFDSHGNIYLSENDKMMKMIVLQESCSEPGEADNKCYLYANLWVVVTAIVLFIIFIIVVTFKNKKSSQGGSYRQTWSRTNEADSAAIFDENV